MSGAERTASYKRNGNARRDWRRKSASPRNRDGYDWGARSDSDLSSQVRVPPSRESVDSAPRLRIHPVLCPLRPNGVTAEQSESEQHKYNSGAWHSRERQHGAGNHQQESRDDSDYFHLDRYSGTRSRFGNASDSPIDAP